MRKWEILDDESYEIFEDEDMYDEKWISEDEYPVSCYPGQEYADQFMQSDFI